MTDFTCPSWIYILTVEKQGRTNQTWYFNTRKDAEEHQRSMHEGYLLRQLTTANRIKGALRGRGQPKMHALAAGIVAENLQFTITQHLLRGGNDE